MQLPTNVNRQPFAAGRSTCGMTSKSNSRRCPFGANVYAQSRYFLFDRQLDDLDLDCRKISSKIRDIRVRQGWRDHRHRVILTRTGFGTLEAVQRCMAPSGPRCSARRGSLLVHRGRDMPGTSAPSHGRLLRRRQCKCPRWPREEKATRVNRAQSGSPSEARKSL